MGAICKFQSLAEVWVYAYPLPSQIMEGELLLGLHFTDDQGSEIWGENQPLKFQFS